MKYFSRISLCLLMGIFAFQFVFAQTETESRRVSSFSALVVNGPFEVELTESERRSVVVEAKARNLDDIETYVDGNTLYIEIRNGYGKKIDAPLKVYVKAPKLEAITGAGATSIQATNTLRMRDLELNLGGASSFTANLRIESLEAELSGACKLTLSGNAEDYEIEMSGACILNAFDLPVADAELSLSGASRAKVNVRDHLEVEASGASNIVVEGDPEIEKSVSGMSKITMR
jgi:hypothetical protein